MRARRDLLTVADRHALAWNRTVDHHEGGELVHFEAPSAGDNVTKDAAYGEVESVKAVSDVIAPLSGEILEVNDKVVEAPETVNEDPYGDGWLVRIRLSDPDEADSLLDVEAYKQVLEGS